MKVAKTKASAPAIFAIAFIVFNVVGMIDLPIYRISALGNGVGIVNTIAIMAMLGGIAAKAALPRILMGKELATIRITNRMKFHRKVAAYAAYLSAVAATIMLSVSVSKGASVGNFDGRFATSGAVFMSLYAAIILNIYFLNIQLIEQGRTNVAFKASFSALLFLAAASGYRSPIIISILCYLISGLAHNRRIGRKLNIKYKFIAVGATAVLVIFSGMYSVYRTSLLYDVRDYYFEYDTTSIPSPLLFLMDPIATMHVDQITISRIIDHVNANGSMRGTLFASNFLSLLPGERLAARNIIGQITTDRVTEAGRPWSITPTIQGALYADFGIWGVGAGMLLIGASLSTLMLWIASRSALKITMGSYVGVNLLMSIHNGYPDVIFYLNMLILIFTYIFGALLAVRFGSSAARQ